MPRTKTAAEERAPQPKKKVEEEKEEEEEEVEDSGSDDGEASKKKRTRGRRTKAEEADEEKEKKKKKTAAKQDKEAAAAKAKEDEESDAAATDEEVEGQDDDDPKRLMLLWMEKHEALIKGEDDHGSPYCAGREDEHSAEYNTFAASVDASFKNPIEARDDNCFYDAEGKLVGSIGHPFGPWTPSERPKPTPPYKCTLRFREVSVRTNYGYDRSVKYCYYAVAIIEATTYLDLKVLRRHVSRGRALIDRHCLFEHLKSALNTTADAAFQPFRGTSTPFKSQVPEKQPSQIVTPMFHYQLDAISWMRDLEARTNVGMPYPTVAQIPGGYTDICVDIDERLFVLPNEEHQTDTMFARGGLFCDEVGLGKTLTMIGLILRNQLSTEYVLDNPRTGNLLRSKATLVLCPSHLAKQWASEVKHTKPKLKVVVIVGILQLRKLTYGDLALADVVVVSFQFLKNKAYTDLIFYEDTDTSHVTRRQDHSWVSELRKRDAQCRAVDLLRKRHPLKHRTPLLEHFMWHRLVLDEGHEVLTNGNDSLFNTIQNFYSTTRWYMTGTPFPNGLSSLNDALLFIGWRTKSGYSQLKNIGSLVPQVCELIHRAMFWRNTKESTKDEYKVPDLVEEIIALEFSKVERGVYDDECMTHGITERLRQLCCHLQISAADRHILGDQKKTLEEVRTILIDHRKHLAESEKTIIERMKEELAELSAKSVKKSETQQHAKLIKTKKEEIGKHELTLRDVQSMLAFLESVVPNIVNSTKDRCVICFDDIKEPSITSCGHVMCTECLAAAFEANPFCPTCRRPLTRKDIIEVKDDAHKEKIDEKADLALLVSKYGTKMGNVIFYVKRIFHEDKNARAIVFSEWDPMLHLVGDTLNEAGISNVFVKGNVFARNKAVAAFTGTDDSKKGVRVIMLSLENAASGLTLTDATHLILLEPVGGSAEEAKAIESQAIGRAHRLGLKAKNLTVVRFVMKDTVEWNIHQRNIAATHHHSVEHSSSAVLRRLSGSFAI